MMMLTRGLATGHSFVAEVEDDQAFIVEKAGEVRAEVPMEPGVMLQPPERRPAEDHEARPVRVAGALEGADGGLIVCGGPGVDAVLLGERQHPRLDGQGGTELCLVGKE